MVLRKEFQELINATETPTDSRRLELEDALDIANRITTEIVTRQAQRLGVLAADAYAAAARAYADRLKELHAEGRVFPPADPGRMAERLALRAVDDWRAATEQVPKMTPTPPMPSTQRRLP